MTDLDRWINDQVGGWRVFDVPTVKKLLRKAWELGVSDCSEALDRLRRGELRVAPAPEDLQVETEKTSLKTPEEFFTCSGESTLIEEVKAAIEEELSRPQTLEEGPLYGEEDRY